MLAVIIIMIYSYIYNYNYPQILTASLWLVIYEVNFFLFVKNDKL